MRRNRMLSAAVCAMLLAVPAAHAAELTDMESPSARYKAELARINSNLGSSIAFSACPEEASTGTKQTVFIFMIGSDMAEYAEYDICEMLGSGYNSKDANVILICGGSDSWSLNALKRGAVTAYRLTENGFAAIDGRTDYNIFDTDDIYNMLFRYMRKFSAEKYSVIFWDHGGGFVNGFGKDTSGANESISPAMLAKVFADIKADAKNDYDLDYRFETAGFDACYMADVQTAAEFARAGFRYFLASEDLESCYGWNYDFLKVFNDNPSASGAELGKAVIDSTRRFSEDCGRNMTLSCVDLSKMDTVTAELEKVAGNILDSGRINDYVAARGASQAYGSGTKDDRFSAGIQDYVDIKSYAAALADSGVDTAALAGSVQDAVVYNYATDGASAGLSVYSYYSSGSDTLKAWNVRTKEKLPSYKRLQQLSHDEINAGTEQTAAQTESRIQVNGNVFTYTMSDTERETARKAQLSVYLKDDTGYRRIAVQENTAEQDGTLYAEYDGTIAYLMNDGVKYPCALNIGRDGYSTELARDCGSSAYAADFRNMRVSLDGSGAVADMRYLMPEGLSGKDDARLDSGDRIYARVPVYSEDNLELGSVPDIFAVHDTQLTLDKISGEYWCRFELINDYGFVQNYSPLLKMGMQAAAEPAVNRKTVEPEDGRTITVSGDAITLPCGFSELESKGFSMVGEPVKLASGQSCMMTMRKNGGYIDVTVKNFGADAAMSNACIVTEVFAADSELFGIRTGDTLSAAGAAAAYTTADTVKYLYSLGGELPELYHGSLGLNGLYSNAGHDYAVFETDRYSGQVRKIGLNSESGVDASAAAVQAYAPEYEAPHSLGYDPYSFTFAMEDTLYSLPVPVSVLTAGGWASDMLDTCIRSGGELDVTMVRGGKAIAAILVNYSDKAAAAADCIVCGIYAEAADAPDLTLSGGISLNDAMKSVSEGDYQAVRDQAPQFRTINGSLSYGSGTELDYDGEISIFGDSVYMYRRYKNMRSMSSFDRLVKYFIY